MLTTSFGPTHLLIRFCFVPLKKQVQNKGITCEISKQHIAFVLRINMTTPNIKDL